MLLDLLDKDIIENQYSDILWKEIEGLKVSIQILHITILLEVFLIALSYLLLFLGHLVLWDLLLGIEVNSLLGKYLVTLESILNLLSIEIELRKLALHFRWLLLLLKLVVDLILHVVYCVVVIGHLELFFRTLKLLKLLIDFAVLEINTSDKLLEYLRVSKLNNQVASIESCFLDLT